MRQEAMNRNQSVTMSNISVCHSQKNNMAYAYEIPDLMKTIYKENPVAYDKYIAGMKVVPEEFTCFKNETCP
jgi:hypothetical protein